MPAIRLVADRYRADCACSVEKQKDLYVGPSLALCWSGVDSRPNDILGVLYQHQTTQEHCSLVGRGIDPRGVDMSMPVAACDGCPQQPALDGEGDYRRKVPIDSVMRGFSHRAGANLCR